MARRFNDVPKDKVGEMVQEFIDAGATKVTVVLDGDGQTCTVTVVDTGTTSTGPQLASPNEP